MRAAGMKPLAVLRAATARSAEALGLAPLGSLEPNASADIRRGDAMADFNWLEYLDLVISSGRVVVSRF
jgi:imidazolonepropionase-like amidohydrolase